MDANFHQLMPAVPLATSENPRTEPTMLWVPEIGILRKVAKMSHIALAPWEKEMQINSSCLTRHIKSAVARAREIEVSKIAQI